MTRVTEALHAAAQGLDTLPGPEIARHLQAAQADALAVVADACAEIAEAGARMAATVRAGGTLVYGGAGSSGLMAAVDALELAGTFGIDPGRVRILMAGGLPVDASMPGETEDDADAARRAALSIRPGDTLVAVSASGSTPYAVALAEAARMQGATVICIANTPSSPLLDAADIAICLPTPPEPVAGSTRMGAGTAQKVALNIMSTIMGMRLGHVHDGMMVNVRADNAKLRARAAGMVARITGVPEADAQSYMSAAGGAVKPAILLAAGAPSRDRAEALLDETDGHLRAALSQLKSGRMAQT